MSPHAHDGRSARRERNRLAALDAAFELFSEGTALPSIDEVAARSGISLRSMYRYFSDAHEMHLLALARRSQVAEPLYRLEGLGEGPLEERVGRIVDQRLRLYDEIAPSIRMAFAMAPTLPALRDQVEARMQLLFEQLREHFAPELDRLPDATGESVLLCLDVLCRFESLERMSAEGALPRDRVRQTLCTGLLALLSAIEDVPPTAGK